ncbi:DNA-directed DNA polymerase I [Candidatus Bathyarchaeota archaeon]|nr:DNA-directed DNA polymerase I [Candidatus Bathyarchaeota archaeon]
MQAEELEEAFEEEAIQPLGRPAPRDLPPSILLSAGYDGRAEKAFLRLYEPSSQQIYIWYDNTGHLPYCISKRSPEELRRNEKLLSHQGFLTLEPIERYDALRDEKIRVTKIVASNPLAIGGQGKSGIRNLIDESWESYIRYYQNYIYDMGLIPGMPYRVEDGKLVEVEYELPEDVKERLSLLVEDEEAEFREQILEWARLLQHPVPHIRRASIDIEVQMTQADRVPNPEEALQPIIAVSSVSSEGLRRVFLLAEEGMEEDIIEGAEVEIFHDEKDLIQEAFRLLDEYPVILTFNGDDFDLRYLRRRGQRLGFSQDEIPITLGRKFAYLRNGVHIDLYRFFLNRAIQVYAFSDRYRENTLDDVASSLIGKRKLQLDFSTSSRMEVARYCLQDALITYELTAFDDDLVMKLMVLLSRISRMTLEDVTRQGVSRWILTLMEYEHRRRGWLIPNKEDILALKGETATKAIIKGRKYLGAMVKEPKAGIHFDVTVLDFASLYPSAIKNWNLSYETILCPHPEDRANIIPGTPHWACRRRRGLTSLIIGSLRDLRVKWYKPLSRDRRLSKEERVFYDVVQRALKVILNASYGVFGAETFSFYCPPLAESTAAIGRYAMTQTLEASEKLGIEVIYGDTDSIFLEQPREEQILELMEWSRKNLGVELDIDKVYRYVVFSRRKKNYVGVSQDGSVDIKGLTGKKRHIPPIIKEAFLQLTRILSGIRRPEDVEGAKEAIRELVERVYNRLRNREFELEELAFRVMLGRSLSSYETNPQHVKAAKMLQEQGISLGVGDIISYVVTQGGVKPVRLASKRDVDVEKYIEYLESMFEQVLEAFEMDLDQIIGRPRMKTLQSFFQR